MAFSLDSIFNSMSAESFIEGIEKTYELSFNQKFVLKDIGITTRVMNHWDAKGLIPLSRNKGKTYKFNFTEFIWLHIVKELREYGFPLESIKEACILLMTPFDGSELFKSLSKEEKEKIKKRIEDIQLDNEDEKRKLIDSIKNEIDNIDQFPDIFQTNLLSFLINEFLMYRNDVRILIDLKGNAVPFTDEFKTQKEFNMVMDEIEFDKDSYLSISLSKFFKRFIMDKEQFHFVQDKNVLNENEAHILSLIREGKAKTITVKFKNQKPYMLEITKEKKIQAETRLTEILLNRGYQDISIRTENGNISYSNITTKKILK